MKENEKKMELLGNAPVPRALLALGLPTMVGRVKNKVDFGAHLYKGS